MAEILHHLVCKKPTNNGRSYLSTRCRISGINSISSDLSLVSVAPLLQEEALAAQQREQLEDVAKSEHQAEAALELCRKETCLPE